jgi:hypothetical protein
MTHLIPVLTGIRATTSPYRQLDNCAATQSLQTTVRNPVLADNCAATQSLQVPTPHPRLYRQLCHNPVITDNCATTQSLQAPAPHPSPYRAAPRAYIEERLEFATNLRHDSWWRGVSGKRHQTRLACSVSVTLTYLLVLEGSLVKGVRVIDRHH